MSTTEWLLVGHLLGAFLLVAAAGSSTAVGVMAGRRRDPRVVGALLDVQHRTELFVTLPGGALAVVFGSLLVDEAGYSFSDAWVSAAYVLILLALAADFGFLVPYNRRVRAAADRLLDAGVTDSEELRAAAGAPVVVATGAVLDLLLVGFLFLMVAKPGA